METFDIQKALPGTIRLSAYARCAACSSNLSTVGLTNRHDMIEELEESGRDGNGVTILSQPEEDRGE